MEREEACMDTELSEQQWKQVSWVLDYIRSFPKGSRDDKQEPTGEPKQQRVNKRPTQVHETYQPTYEQLRLFEEVRYVKQ
jgi:hypothetical protein